jgi:hypothetical protein
MGNSEGLVGQVVPLVDAVKLENRLTLIEEGIKAVNANVNRVGGDMDDGFTRITNRQDIANGRVNTLEAAERARSQREAIGQATELGAQQFRLGVKAKVGIGAGAFAFLLSAAGAVAGLLEKI